MWCDRCQRSNPDWHSLAQAASFLIRGNSERRRHYQSGVEGRRLSLVTTPSIKCGLNLRAIRAAPSMLLQTRRTPPLGKCSIVEIPTFSATQAVTTWPWSSATRSTRLIVSRPVWPQRSRRLHWSSGTLPRRISLLVPAGFRTAPVATAWIRVADFQRCSGLGSRA
jgi:hypothetical protein